MEVDLLLSLSLSIIPQARIIQCYAAINQHDASPFKHQWFS